MRSKKSVSTVTKVGGIKVVVAPPGGDSQGAGSAYNYRRGHTFLQEELYGARLNRVSGMYTFH